MEEQEGVMAESVCFLIALMSPLSLDRRAQVLLYRSSLWNDWKGRSFSGRTRPYLFSVEFWCGETRWRMGVSLNFPVLFISYLYHNVIRCMSLFVCFCLFLFVFVCLVFVIGFVKVALSKRCC